MFARGGFYVCWYCPGQWPLAGGPGFEPGFSESESDVLPLDDPPPADSTAPDCSAAGWYMQQCRGTGVAIEKPGCIGVYAMA